MRINANISAVNAGKLLKANDKSLAKSMEKLSSGRSINRAGDNAAGLAISEKLKAQMTALNRAASNAYDGISFIQTAEGGLSETHAALQDMREAAVQASNGTATDSDRAQLQQKVTQLNADITRIAENTEFNTQKVLDGTFAESGFVVDLGNTQVETPATVHINPMSAAELGLENLDLSTAEGASAAIEAIDRAIEKVSAQRAELGSARDRLEYSINNLGTAEQNIISAGSQISDVDMAEEMAKYTTQNILQQANIAMLAQSNKQAGNLLNLLQ